jgi:hypothetical protein
VNDHATITTGRQSRAQTGPVRERCEWSDLHVDECAHCQGLGSPVVSIGTVERVLGRRAPEYRFRDRVWRVEIPVPTSCEHRRDDLCPECDVLLDGLLYDLPELIEQLTIALRKGHRFAPHGFRRGDVERPDEAPIPWSPAAATALDRLRRIVTDRPEDRRVLLRRLSAAAARAHRVIDRPRDRDVTACPVCRSEIPLPARTAEAEVPIVCPATECSYSASWDQHQADLLDASGDVMLTAEEVRFVLARNGEPISRQRISYLVQRHGLPRERIVVPSWRGKRLVTDAQWAYRLRDVRDLQARLAS